MLIELPVDILIQILTLLTPREIKQLYTLNHRIYSLINSHRFWERKLAHDYVDYKHNGDNPRELYFQRYHREIRVCVNNSNTFTITATAEDTVDELMDKINAKYAYKLRVMALMHSSKSGCCFRYKFRSYIRGDDIDAIATLNDFQVEKVDKIFLYTNYIVQLAKDFVQSLIDKDNTDSERKLTMLISGNRDEFSNYLAYLQS